MKFFDGLAIRFRAGNRDRLSYRPREHRVSVHVRDIAIRRPASGRAFRTCRSAGFPATSPLRPNILNASSRLVLGVRLQDLSFTPIVEAR